MEKLVFRKAIRSDVPDIVQLLADDKLGSQREDFQIPLPNDYYKAFDRIAKDNNQELILVFLSEELLGTMQLSFIPYLTYRGGIRAQIEAVRIHKSFRGKGYGHIMINWAIDRAKEKGAHLIQLTTDKQRPEAIQFYTSLGFKASHVGMKMPLD